MDWIMFNYHIREIKEKEEKGGIIKVLVKREIIKFTFIALINKGKRRKNRER